MRKVAAGGVEAGARARGAGLTVASLIKLEIFTAAFLIAFFGFIFIIPAFATFWYSANNVDILSNTARFIGTRNYERIVRDQLFWNGLRVAAIFTVLQIIVGLVLQVTLAALLTALHGFRQKLLITCFFLPAVLPSLATIMIWRNMFRVDYGLIDVTLKSLGLQPIPWLSDANLALLAIIIVTTWRYLGYGAVIFLAGFNEIPDELYEAARIDGAGALRQFFWISLPLIRPVLLLQVVASVITLLQFFDPFYALTGGGPSNATKTLILHIYEESFLRLNFGTAAAMTTVLFLILVVASALQLRIGRRYIG